MRALVLSGLRQVCLEERREPVPGPGEVLLRVAACGICGSDLHGFLGEEPRRQPGLCLGHECVGTIASAHPSLPLGTRVAVNPLMPCLQCAVCATGRTQLCPTKRLIGLDQNQGAFAEFTVIAARNVLPLSDRVSDAVACLIEPLACAVHLLALAAVPPLSPAVLFGGGTLGAMTLVVARRLGYQVTVVEPSPGRRAMALALGASAALDPSDDVLAATGGPVPLTIDCTGVAPARQAAVRVARPGGTVLLLGTTDLDTALDWRDVVRRELRLQASYGFCADEFRRAKELVEADSAGLEAWCATRPLAEGQAAFESLLPTPEHVLKVVLQP